MPTLIAATPAPTLSSTGKRTLVVHCGEGSCESDGSFAGGPDTNANEHPKHGIHATTAPIITLRIAREYPGAAAQARSPPEREEKRRALLGCGFGPDAAAVAHDDPVHDGQAHTGTLELHRAMQALEDLK